MPPGITEDDLERIRRFVSRPPAQRTPDRLRMTPQDDPDTMEV
jgi:hypothetical protein